MGGRGEPGGSETALALNGEARVSPAPLNLLKAFTLQISGFPQHRDAEPWELGSCRAMSPSLLQEGAWRGRGYQQTSKTGRLEGCLLLIWILLRRAEVFSIFPRLPSVTATSPALCLSANK